MNGGKNELTQQLQYTVQIMRQPCAYPAPSWLDTDSHGPHVDL